MDGRTSGEAICDECLSKSSTPDHIKSAPWDCDYCGDKIYKFAHGNALSDVLINRVSATVRLDYGRMEIEVTCKKCKEKQWKVVDWGWLP
jgi:ribosomal protein L37AE/L43A